MFFLGMIPFWMYTLGQLLMTTETDIEIRVPFMNILTSLVSLILPILAGIMLKKYKPKWAEKWLKVTRVCVFVFILFMFTFGLYANLYVFRLFTWQLVIGGCCLPYIGFIMGGLMSFICRVQYSHIITICLETGIQNTGIAILLMRLTLPQPDANLSIIAPVVVSMMTPIPLGIALAFIEVKKRYKKYRNKDHKFEKVEMIDGDVNKNFIVDRNCETVSK